MPVSASSLQDEDHRVAESWVEKCGMQGGGIPGWGRWTGGVLGAGREGGGTSGDWLHWIQSLHEQIFAFNVRTRLLFCTSSSTGEEINSPIMELLCLSRERENMPFPWGSIGSHCRSHRILHQPFWHRRSPDIVGSSGCKTISSPFLSLLANSVYNMDFFNCQNIKTHFQ